MAWQTVPDQPKRSTFWKPEKVGDVVEGRYLRIEPPKAGKEKFGETFIIRESDGHELSLPNHEGLCSKMRTLSAGYAVRIEYKGKEGKTFLYQVDFDTQLQTSLNAPTTAQIDVMPGILAKVKELKMVSDERLEMIAEVVAGEKERGEFALKILKNEGKLHKDAVRGWVVS